MQSHNIFYDITGKLVHAQVGFPTGTVVSCYATGSTCSTILTDVTLDFADNGSFAPGDPSRNPCCFILNPFQFLSGEYYTALGSRCQSCSGKKLFKETYVMVSYLTET